jgi:hypothetical protein
MTPKPRGAVFERQATFSFFRLIRLDTMMCWLPASWIEKLPAGQSRRDRRPGFSRYPYYHFPAIFNTRCAQRLHWYDSAFKLSAHRVDDHIGYIEERGFLQINIYEGSVWCPERSEVLPLYMLLRCLVCSALHEELNQTPLEEGNLVPAERHVNDQSAAMILFSSI